MLRHLVAFGAVTSVIAEHNDGSHGRQLAASTGRGAELSKREAGTAQQNSSYPKLPSREKCAVYEGEISDGGKVLCLQQVDEPTCPIGYFHSAVEHCYWVARFVSKEYDADTKVQVNWWTSTDCLTHRTRCEVSHPKHGNQTEDETYDFGLHCDEIAEIKFFWLYYLSSTKDNEWKHYLVSMAQLRHGMPELLMNISDRESLVDRPVREVFRAVRYYERDSAGRVTYSDQGIDLSTLPPAGRGMEGLYAQIEYTTVVYSYNDTELAKFALKQTHIRNQTYHVTTKRLLDICPPNKRIQWANITQAPAQNNNHVSAESDDDNVGLLVGVISGVVVFVALLSVGLYCYLSRRERYTKHAEVEPSPQSQVQSQTPPHHAMYPGAGQ